jgi:hypothetical protein
VLNSEIAHPFINLNGFETKTSSKAQILRRFNSRQPILKAIGAQTPPKEQGVAKLPPRGVYKATRLGQCENKRTCKEVRAFHIVGVQVELGLEETNSGKFVCVHRNPYAEPKGRGDI